MKIQKLLASKGKGVQTISPKETIREAIKLLAEHDIGALMVVDEADKPIGVLSERDIIRAAADDHEAIFSFPVESAMTTAFVSARPEEDIHSVAQHMTEKVSRYIPVMEDDHLIGVVTLGDLITGQRDKFQGENDMMSLRLEEQS